MTRNHVKDGIVLASAILVLTIGMATGNAWLMFALATGALVAGLFLFGKRLTATAIATVLAAMVAAAGAVTLMQ